MRDEFCLAAVVARRNSKFVLLPVSGPWLLTKLMIAIRKVASLCLAVAPIAPLSAQTNWTFYPDRDVTLYEDVAGSLANGSGTAMFVGTTNFGGKRRGLVHFDLSTIPTGSRVLSTSLIVSSTQSPSTSVMTMTAHRLLQHWSEGPTVAPGGQGLGGAAQNGDSTWLHRDLPTQLWTNPGGDFASPSFTMDVQAVGLSSSGFRPGITSDVQSWIDNPASNYGWLFKGDESLSGTARKLVAREAGLGAGVQLGVTFLLPGQVGQWGPGCTGSVPMNLLPTGPANSGTTVSLQYFQTPASSIGASFFALELEYGPGGVGLPIPPNCAAYLPLGGLVAGNLWLTNTQGQSSDTFTIPANAAGFLVVCQGAALDSSVLGFKLSNAAVMLTQ